MAGEDSGSGESTSCGGGCEAVEAGEDVWNEGMAGAALDVVLVGVDIAAAESGGFA